jgi:hypothetical protein
MAMARTCMVAAAVGLAFAMQPLERAFAACNATVNGRPMSHELCALATRVYGGVVPGHYWVDDQGNWGRMGSSYAEGNLLRDKGRGGQPWTYRGAGGAAGSDGECMYYNDPDTGASVMSGNC